jgi:WD40 repeat protein
MVMLSDGRMASVSGDKTMKIWNVETNQCEQTFFGHENYVLCLTEVKDFQGNDTNIRVATGSEDCTIRLWNVHRGDCERIVNCPGVVYSILQLSDSRIAIAAAGDTILLWNYQKYLEMLLHDGNVKEKSISLTLQEAESYLVKLSGHRLGVTILLELENHRLLSSSIDRKIRIWNVQNGRCERLFSLSTGRLSSITRCKDSVGSHSRFLSSGYDGSIFIWSPVIDESCDLE